MGWTLSWRATYLRVPGRGYTLDDPDLWAICTIYIGGFIYLVSAALTWSFGMLKMAPA